MASISDSHDDVAACVTSVRLSPASHLYPAQRQAIIFAEVRDRLVVGSEPTQQPHDLDIASGLSFQPPARLYSV